MRIKRLLLFTLLILFACNNNSSNKKNTIINEIIIKHIDLYPQYPGCKDYYQQEKQLKCLIEKMNTFINYMIEKKYQQKFISLKDTLWIQFVIDTAGNTLPVQVIYKNNPNTTFDSIFQDISHKIPTIKPAIYQDKPINFIFKIPIINTKETLR